MTNYSERFQDTASVAAYESQEYGANSYSSFIWNLQKPVLQKIVSDFCRDKKNARLLDFACGTGRVISTLENFVAEADGVDISENMVRLAREKCRKSRLQVGDIFSQPELLCGNYDVITAFRFLLNVEPEIRERALKKLRAALSPEGLLIVNVHGNSRSLRHPAILWRRWRERSLQSGAMLNEMSPQVTKQLLADCGFAVVRRFGFGILPPTFHRTPLRKVAQAFDRTLAGENFLAGVAIDLLYLCRAV